MRDAKQFKIVGLGEVLWDMLPTGKQLGGAPANFAFIATQLGDCGIVASRVGSDADGKEIIKQLQAVGVEAKNIQIDREHPTGTVQVLLERGQPNYQITESVAWDFLDLSDDWRRLANECDAVCCGSLAQRGAVSKRAIQDFISLTRADCRRIFDVNLRQNYFSLEVLRQSFELANIVKLNHEELPMVAEMFSVGGASENEFAANLRRQFDLRLVCVTRGKNGSLLAAENETSQHAGFKVEIADTIGAGDAFTATLAHGILRGWDLTQINEKANRVGAFVASQTGAMPHLKNV